VSVSVSVSLCLSVSLSVCLSVTLCLSLCLSVSICLSVCHCQESDVDKAVAALCLSLCMSLCACLSLCLSVCLCMSLSVSVCMSVCHCQESDVDKAVAALWLIGGVDRRLRLGGSVTHELFGSGTVASICSLGKIAVQFDSARDTKTCRLQDLRPVSCLSVCHESLSLHPRHPACPPGVSPQANTLGILLHCLSL